MTKLAQLPCSDPETSASFPSLLSDVSFVFTLHCVLVCCTLTTVCSSLFQHPRPWRACPAWPLTSLQHMLLSPPLVLTGRPLSAGLVCWGPHLTPRVLGSCYSSCGKRASLLSHLSAERTLEVEKCPGHACLWGLDSEKGS